ncbi:MAG: endonuclease, partial [Pseudomonadota bacterium]
MARLISVTTLLVALLATTTAASADLRGDLHAATKDPHRPIGYSQTDEAMEEIYRDPGAASNVLLFYTGRSQDADLWVSRDGRDGWNREHVWPQSRGVRPFPMKSDLHNLKPTDASVNQRRGNLNFDEGGSPEGEAPDTFLDGDSFEPRDAVKGDVARALFYMDVRYEGTGGEPDLRLVEGTTATGGHTIGDLCTLLAWHRADPPDAAEVENNGQIEDVQGNRNPFIDDADLAVALHGDACGIESGEREEEEETGRANALRIGTWNIAN